MYSVIPLAPTSTTPRLVVAVLTSAGPVALPALTELTADDALLAAADAAEPAADVALAAADVALSAADDSLLPAASAAEPATLATEPAALATELAVVEAEPPQAEASNPTASTTPATRPAALERLCGPNMMSPFGSVSRPQWQQANVFVPFPGNDLTVSMVQPRRNSRARIVLARIGE
jgi:hypothetical protein